MNPLMSWFDRTILDLGRQMRLTYLPPLMVYLAAGISSLTAVVGAFFVKDHLDLSAEFLAGLGFWAGLPWALKMPLGHLVDLIWRYKSVLVYLGASLIATSLLIMLGLLLEPAQMATLWPSRNWYVLAVLLGPIGYVLQDVVADAMTVEAVPRFAADGQPLSDEVIKLGHTTMQMLGRVAIIGGGAVVPAVSYLLVGDTTGMDKAAKLLVYARVYAVALVIPLLSVAGVLLMGLLLRREARRRRAAGLPVESERVERPPVNWWIMGGGLLFAAIALGVGLTGFEYAQELIFAASFLVIGFLLLRLLRELSPAARATMVGTAILIFVYRALPLAGDGIGWWQIDALGFDEQFLNVLQMIGAILTFVGLFLFRRFIAEHSITYIVAWLTLLLTALSLPTLGMAHGLHTWTAAHSDGVVDARFIAVFNTALESPLGQVAMIPMLAWIANSAPERLKATYFAVMA